MSSSEIALIFRWIVPFWALGWLVLPLSSRLFGALPDRGLAAGRVVFLVLAGLAAFWGAALHLVPLGNSIFFLLTLSLFGLAGCKPEFRASIRPHLRVLAVSDAVFLLAFGAFLWVRMRHPEINDLEKPMDMALLSAGMRAEWLPFQNPWFAGQEFTNYYYFGPLLGAMWARFLATPPYLAYNLVQPIFCALFLSTLWSLSAALARSGRAGLLAMLLVGVGGHFEPLRQWSQTGQAWPVDWWKTSRVIEGTINEYPAFTLLVGDLHAHFIAFCLATTHFCACFCLIQADSARKRSALLLLGGVLLGVFALTNTWDTPFYGLLWLACALWKRKSGAWTRANDFALGGALILAPLVALPYFWKFKSQVSGVVFNPWLPDLFSLALLWGSWWMLGLWALTLRPVGSVAEGDSETVGDSEPTGVAAFRRFLIGFGALALLFPFVFYIRGAFGDGDLRHQDTVFKFGLQAWLLLGTGIACEAGARFRAWWHAAIAPFRFAALATGAAFFAVIGLAPAGVAWTRAVRDAPRAAFGQPILSLNAARFIAPDELEGIEWLRLHARPGESVVEAVGSDPNGGLGGDYDANIGRVAAFSGVPCTLGWPQHVAAWGAPWPEIQLRGALVRQVYSGDDPATALRELGATYVFFGADRWDAATTRRFERPGFETARGWFGQPGNAPQISRFKG